MKTKTDPTGQKKNRRAAAKSTILRLNKAEKQVKVLFRALNSTSRRKTSIVNAETTTVYDYDFDLQAFQAEVDIILNDQLLETQTGDMPSDWYWMEDIEKPFRQGTLEEVRDFDQMIAAAISAGLIAVPLAVRDLPVEQVLRSEKYLSTLNNYQVTAFSDIKGLSSRTSAQVIQQINSGIQAGESPTKIASQISERFGVAKTSAARTAVTEVNKAFNDAKLAATNLMQEQTGFRAGVIHISALLPTTRNHHAARHGNAYTVEDQTQWWNTGANRINCHCTTQSVLLDANNRLVDPETQNEIKSDRDFFSEAA